MKRFLLLFALTATFSSFSILLAQQQKVSGVVTDKNSREPQGFANVIVKGTTNGASTDANGKFELMVDFGDSSEIILQVSYVGFETQELPVSKGVTYVEFRLKPKVVYTKEVVVSASRVGESLMEAPVQIQKISAKQVENSASGDFYQGLGNMQGIDIVSSSFGFKAVNARGFNTTSPVRSVQFIDGMDNQAPGLNFPIGNLVGASDLDIDNVEVINGAASALYGANALQGIINMTTKDPYKYPGLDVMVKGGNREMINGQFRFAKTFGKDNRIGFKLTGDYMTADDWVASDTGANKYGDLETEVDLTKIVVQKQFDATLTQDERDDFIALNAAMDFFPVAYPGKLTIRTPGYMEKDIVSVEDPKARSVKTGIGLYYNLTDSLQASYLFKYGEGSAIYQGTNRYAIKNIRFQQHKLELKGKSFAVKGYTTTENAGDSYDIVFTGINLSKIGIANQVSNYLGEYFSVLQQLTDTFDNEPNKSDVDSAHTRAAQYVENNPGWLKPGTAEYDSIWKTIVTNPDFQIGSKFTDRSSLQHLEGQYNFSLFDFADVITGIAGRRYDPQSYGTIFSDTLMNPADTLENGAGNPDGEYVDISSYEIGGYAQFTKKVLEDKLKLTASIRADKNKNYREQFSPRFSGVYSFRDHNFRFALQQAFRAPTLQNQYLLLDIGPITLAGNLNGVKNAYTLESVQEFKRIYNDSVGYNALTGDSIFEIRMSDVLKPMVLDPIKPENVTTLEFGYRGVITSGFYIDLSAYYSIYSNFIGDIRLVKLLEDGTVAGEESGEDALINNSEQSPTYKVYQFPTNSTNDVYTYGGTVGLNYFFKTFIASGNYTYSDIDTSGLDDGIIPGFNTPKHKFNIGLDGNKVYKNFGFSTRFRWNDSFRWESSFGDGDVPSYYTVDAQVNYEFPIIRSTLRIGASNLLDAKVRQAYGSPEIGRLVFTSWTFKM